jgi:hypothetical protein
MLGNKPDGHGPASVKEVKTPTYEEVVSHPLYRKANKMVHSAENLLQDMGLNKLTARGWIRAWISGAGDGSE